MTRILAWLGFEGAALGRPPTARQIRTNRWAVIKLMCLLAAGSLVALLLTVPFDQVMSTPTGVPALLASAVVFGVLLTAMTGAQDLIAMSAMGTGFCPQVKSWAENYPEIRAHITAINQEPRQIAMCDYYFMRAWVEEQETARRNNEARQACKALHGIGAQ